MNTLAQQQQVRQLVENINLNPQQLNHLLQQQSLLLQQQQQQVSSSQSRRSNCSIIDVPRLSFRHLSALVEVDTVLPVVRPVAGAEYVET